MTKPLTKGQATCLTVMTGCLLMRPADFRAEIAKRLGRDVTAPEFADPDFVEELQDRYRDEFQAMMELVEESGLLLPPGR